MFNIILSEHLNEQREYLKGYRRLRKPFNFDSKVMQKILEPIKSKIKKFSNQRFVLKINESTDSSMEIYFLLKFEILEDQETIVVISSLKQEKGFKGSLKMKRYLAGMDNNYLVQILDSAS